MNEGGEIPRLAMLAIGLAVAGVLLCPAEAAAAALPPVTGQFIAAGIEHDAWRDEPGRRVEIAQSSSWRRETRRTEEGTSNAYNDSQSQVSVTWFRAHDGGREVLSAHIARISGYSSVSHAVTDRTDRLFGERCTIWEGQFTHRDPPPRRSYETCVTADGIIFWQRFHHRDGAMRETFRLTRLDRGDVRGVEIMPPRHIFEWPRWRDASGVPAAGGGDLEIELASPPPEENIPIQTDSETVRVSGAWTYTQTVDGGASRSWRIEAPTLRLNYTESEQDAADRRLQIWRGPASEYERLDHASSVEPARGGQILGLSCQWVNTMIVSHGSITACRTHDGVTLARRQVCDGARGGNCYFDVRATRLSRDPIPESALAPPPQAFDWPSAPD
jgi:hypothetical protein